MEEIWVTIQEAPDYLISNLGRVKNKKWNRLMTRYYHQGMHPYVHIKKGNGVQVKRYIEDIMSDYFV